MVTTPSRIVAYQKTYISYAKCSSTFAYQALRTIRIRRLHLTWFKHLYQTCHKSGTHQIGTQIFSNPPQNVHRTIRCLKTCKKGSQMQQLSKDMMRLIEENYKWKMDITEIKCRSLEAELAETK